MWVISKIGFVTKAGETKYESFYFMSDYGLRNFNIVVHLRDTETGNYKVLRNQPDSDAFLEDVRKYNPYGYINRNHNRGRIALDDVLVCIDELSLQFLDFVDHVEMLSVPKLECSFYRNLQGNFLGLDSNCTVFVQNASGRCGCTLFHALCYSTSGWVNNDFYLFCREHKDGAHGEILVVLYRVVFKDVQSARRMLAKAAVSGINPVRQHETVEIR